MILGLDISTSITGFCILGTDSEIIRCDAWDFRNKNRYSSEFKKAAHIKEQLCSIKAQYPIEKVYIEKPFVFFKGGGSSGKTMAILQRFNGMVSWIVKETFDQDPFYFTAQQARKALDIKVPRGHRAKEEVIKWLLDKAPSFSVEYTKFGNPKPKYFDIADAIVIAKAGLATLNAKQNSNS
jgi:Holliday junction resolvasome RuvABC endonuclease subunit